MPTKRKYEQHSREDFQCSLAAALVGQYGVLGEAKKLLPGTAQLAAILGVKGKFKDVSTWRPPAEYRDKMNQGELASGATACALLHDDTSSH